MRKFANRLIAILFLLLPLASLAQTSISGRVVNEKDGTGIEGATVMVRGKNTGTKTDANGNFTITASRGDVLVISSVNFAEQQIRVGNNTTVTVSLASTSGTMEEVVVTAMDIKRNPRELGYSVQRVTGSEVQETQRENFLNALGGRVAGVSLTPTSGNAGASTNIVLRGYNSLALSNQPLFVVDGTIVDNSVIDENSNGGSGLGLVEAPTSGTRPINQTTNRGNDYTNRVSDMNPNDIESITVLKGPEATALYGSQASSGAIIITTKKAKLSATKKIRLGSINYDNSFRLQFVERLPEILTDYEMGTNGRIDSSFTYFGPKLAPGTPRRDQAKDFFKTGFAQTHNLTVDVGNKDMSFKLSGSAFDQTGTIPDNRYTRYTFRISNTTRYKNLVEITPAFTYTHSINKKPIRSSNGYLTTLLRWPVNDDISIAYNPDGTKREIYTAGDPNEELDNPLWNVENNRSYDKLNKQNYSLGINIYPMKWLTVAGRFGYETYQNDGWTFYHPETFLLTRATRGSQDNYYRKYTGYNHTITATAKHSIGKFNGRLMVGTMWQDYKTSAWSVFGTGIADPTTFTFDPKRIGDSSVTTLASRNRLYRNNTFHDYNYRQQRQLAYFGEFAVNWNNIVFLNYTHRFEEGSTLPKINRKVNYPAGSVSVIFTDLIKPLKKSKILSYGKLRASLASTAKANSPYSNQSFFIAQTSSGGGFGYDFNNANFQLLPEKQSTYEFGTELRFFRSRLSIDATYYNTLNKDQILELVRTSYGTGFILNTLNLSSTRNQGVEISTSYKIVERKDLTWNFGLNFTKSWNKLLTLPDNLPEFYISDTWLFGNARAGLRRGGPTTSITSVGYLRNNAGQVLIEPTTGLPVTDNNFLVRGDRNPDFTLGINNSVRYKNWTLNMLWDAKVGGDVFNGNELYLTTIGRSRLTADRETPQIVTGVLRDGLENTANPTPNNIVIYPYLNQSYYQGAATSALFNEEYFIEKDVSFMRLRDLTISYNFRNLLRKNKVMKSLSMFVTANNLILISNYTGADPAVNGSTPATRGVGAFGFDFGTVPEPISLNFGLRAGF
jgi:TonB-linked SusC/RagA family outer membrane protein